MSQVKWQLEYTGHIALLLGSVAIGVELCVYGWRHLTVPGATAFAFLTGISAAWWLFGAAELAGAGLPTKLLWRGCTASTRVPVAAAALCFVPEHAGRGRWLARRAVSSGSVR